MTDVQKAINEREAMVTKILCKEMDSVDDLLYYWKLTKSIGAKKIRYEDFDVVKSVDNDVYGVKRIGTTLLIVIAGSNDLKDWYKNLKIVKVPKTNNICKGFYYSAKSMRLPIERLLGYYEKTMGYPIRNIICIGHSRGEALSEEINRHLVKRLNRKSRVVGFAGPKMGGSAYVKESEELGLVVDRYEYGKDLVPKLPPSAKKYGTIHKLKQPWFFKLPIFIYIHCNYQHGLKKLEL